MLMAFDAKRDDLQVREGGHNLNNTYWLNMNPLGNGNFSGGGFRIDRVNLATGVTDPVALPAGRFEKTSNTVSLQMDGRSILFSNNTGSFALGFHHTATMPFSQDPRYHLMF
jgi:hypothetical protein